MDYIIKGSDKLCLKEKKMIRVFENTIIYVACPAQVMTGGPELLHQLVYKLNSIGIPAKIYYFNKYNGNPTPSAFKEYNVEYVLSIDDNKKNVVIVPEISVRLLRKYKKIRKGIWWLSVDNYFESLGFITKCFRNKYIKKIVGNITLNPIKNNNQIQHLAQSYYAIDFLNKQGIKNIDYLSDYINDIFLQRVNEIDMKVKQLNVVYNPKKGYEFTKKIIKKSREFNWIPIQNMTPKEVAILLKKSKVYVDFGNHPGKDRIPREAAICGCCVISSKRGSAKFLQDVPIKKIYKFDDYDENIDGILNTIKYCLYNYDEAIKDFDSYRKEIKEQEIQFENDIKRIFIREY